MKKNEKTKQTKNVLSNAQRRHTFTLVNAFKKIIIIFSALSHNSIDSVRVFFSINTKKNNKHRTPTIKKKKKTSKNTLPRIKGIERNEKRWRYSVQLIATQSQTQTINIKYIVCEGRDMEEKRNRHKNKMS